MNKSNCLAWFPNLIEYEENPRNLLPHAHSSIFIFFYFFLLLPGMFQSFLFFQRTLSSFSQTLGMTGFKDEHRKQFKGNAENDTHDTYFRFLP